MYEGGGWVPPHSLANHEAERVSDEHRRAAQEALSDAARNRPKRGPRRLLGWFRKR